LRRNARYALACSERFMTALAIWAIRGIVLFVIIRIVLSLFAKKPVASGQRHEGPGRFDAKGKSVEDGDFKEL